MQDRIAYGMPDVLGSERARYAGKTVAVLGAGHSAIGTLIDLARLKDEEPATEIIWLLRGDNPEKSFGGGANDKLAARGELGAAFAGWWRSGKSPGRDRLPRLAISAATARTACASAPARPAAAATCIADELVVATGFRPDLRLPARAAARARPGARMPAGLAPLIDPNLHSCGTVRPHGARELAQPEPGFYFAGMKSYGRAPTFLMLTGYEQVRSIVAEIAGDHEAAERVELVLPETGVCSRPLAADRAMRGLLRRAGTCRERMPAARRMPTPRRPATRAAAAVESCAGTPHCHLHITIILEIYVGMNESKIVAALAALAHQHRLRIFRLLVKRGPSGLPAGEIAERVGIGADQHVLPPQGAGSRRPAARDARRPLRALRGACRGHAQAAEPTSPRTAARAGPSCAARPSRRLPTSVAPAKERANEQTVPTTSCSCARTIRPARSSPNA